MNDFTNLLDKIGNSLKCNIVMIAFLIAFAIESFIIKSYVCLAYEIILIVPISLNILDILSRRKKN